MSQNNKQNRDAFVYAFVGHNRTGKSVTARRVAEKYKKENPNNIIVSYDPQSRFVGVSDERILTPDWQEYIDKEYFDCLFVVDDYHMVVEERIDKSLTDLFALRDERGLDFIFITHQPKLIRKKISYYITHLYLYFTMGTDTDFKDRLTDTELAIKCRHFINEYVNKYGKGSYEEGFPYLRINCIESTVQAININKKL